MAEDTPDSKTKRPRRVPDNVRSNPDGTRRQEPVDEATAAATGQTGEDLARVALDFEEKLTVLPPRQRLIALLGFTKDIEAKYLPDGYKAVQVTVPRRRMADIERIIGGSAFPVSSEFRGNPDDENIVLTYIVPFEEDSSPNLDNLASALRAERIQAEISVASNRPIVIRAKGNELNLLGPDFSEKKRINVQDPITRKMQKTELPAETAYASMASYESAKSDPVNIPRQGGCAYMLLEDKFVDKIQDARDEDLRNILRQISHIFSAPNFHISRQGSFLVIINTADRAGAFLTSLSMGLKQASDGRVKATVGKGEIIHLPRGRGFEMKGFVRTNANEADIMGYEDDVYLRAEMYDPARQRLVGRDGAQYKTVAERYWQNEDLYRVIEHKPSVEFKVGGPDKLIGYTEELGKLNTALTDRETKLIMLRASAGMGKSALLDEAKKTNPSIVATTIDPSQKDVPGGGLVKIVADIIEQVEENAEASDAHPILHSLREFQKQIDDKKLSFAQRNPRELTSMCLRALDFLREKLGSVKLVIDDVHHIDRHSDPYVMAMVSQLLSGEGNDKVLLSMRPEDRYVTPAQRSLETQTRSQGEGKVKVVTLNGLDFSSDEVTEEWVMHSLPRETTEGNHLAGDWWQKLGAKAGKFPLAMVTYMDEIKIEQAKAKKHHKIPVLRVSEKEIRLSDECLARLLKKIPAHGDLGRYYQEKQNRLPQYLQAFMHSVALLGGAISEAQIAVVSQIIGQPVTAQELEEVLLAGCYLVGGADRKYRFKHQTISDTVLDSMDAEKKVDLSFRLYLQFRGDASITEGTKLTLLHNVAPHVKSENERFWQEYSRRVRGSLTEANVHNSYDHGHALTTTVLGDPKTFDRLGDGQGTVIQQNLMQLRRQPNAQVTPEMHMMIIESLAELGRDAMMIGQFEESACALSILEEIAEKNPQILRNSKQIYLLMLQLAYVTKDGRKMRQIYEQKLGNGSHLEPAEKAVYDVQVAYMANVTGTKPDVTAVKRAHEQNAPFLRRIVKNPTDPNYAGYLEVIRLVMGRVPFEEIRDTVVNREGGKKFDEDVILQTKALKQGQLSRLMEINEVLMRLLAQREEVPTAFTPHGEMGLMDLQAQVKAMLGRCPEAISTFSEFWRQANQMEMHGEAARAAKMKGDVQMVQGLSRHQIDRERVLEAIKTYGEEGVKSLTGVSEKSFYQLSIRIQRIRAIGVLAQSYLYEMETRRPLEGEIDQMKNAILDHIGEAFKDFDYINEKWAHLAKSPEVQYYLMSYMGYIMQATKVFNITAPYMQESPYVDAAVIASGQRYAEEVIVDATDGSDLKEKQRKQQGLAYMTQFAPMTL